MSEVRGVVSSARAPVFWRSLDVSWGLEWEMGNTRRRSVLRLFPGPLRDLGLGEVVWKVASRKRVVAKGDEEVREDGLWGRWAG